MLTLNGYEEVSWLEAVPGFLSNCSFSKYRTGRTAVRSASGFFARAASSSRIMAAFHFAAAVLRETFRTRLLDGWSVVGPSSANDVRISSAGGVVKSWFGGVAEQRSARMRDRQPRHRVKVNNS